MTTIREFHSFGLPFYPAQCHNLCRRGYNNVNPNSNPVCGRKITATCKFTFTFKPHGAPSKAISSSDKGKSVTITVADRCDSCAETDLDFSPTAFSDLADLSVGRLEGVDWHWA